MISSGLRWVLTARLCGLFSLLMSWFLLVTFVPKSSLVLVMLVRCAVPCSTVLCLYVRLSHIDVVVLILRVGWRMVGVPVSVVIMFTFTAWLFPSPLGLTMGL